MKYLSFMALLSILLLMATSCEYDHPAPVPIDVDSVSFANDLIPFFDQSCNMAGCHAVGEVKPDLTAANAYTSLFAENQIDLDNPKNSKLYWKLASGTMTQYSTPTNTQLVLIWIEQGALNN